MSAAPRAMRLDALLRGIADPPHAGDIVISGLSQDSRSVRAGEAFVALAGARTHGFAFAPVAVERGAAAILAESVAHAPNPDIPVKSPVIWIENLRMHLGEIAARFFDHPSEAMTLIGVTGTNGKTSTVQMLAQALTALGQRAATIGTLGAGLYGALRPSERTTPDVISVHALLAKFRDAGVTCVAMEVSSHALDQHRVDAVGFDVAVFTNLTRDHLDYHGTMEAYGAAKAKLFAWPSLCAAIINVDDAFGRELAAELAAADAGHRSAIPAGEWRQSSATDGNGNQFRGRKKIVRCGIENADAEIRAVNVRTHADGIDFTLQTPWGEGALHSKLLGRFNVANLLAVAGVLGALEIPFAQLSDVLEALEPVAGRMNRLGGGACPLVVVDYAHTPDALQQALTTLRAHCAGRLICVFGAGGERDAGKRPQMGAIAEANADVCIITDDNPRGEDGDAIAAAILSGFAQPQRAKLQRDRARAIELALHEAQADDVVLIAGKGHEAYQESAGSRRPFDDLAIARHLLEARTC